VDGCPLRVASYQIISRHIRATVARTNRFPRWRGLYRFWRWSRRYHRSSNPPGLNSLGVPENRATAVEYLGAHKLKMLTFRTIKDVDQVLAQYSVCPAKISEWLMARLRWAVDLSLSMRCLSPSASDSQDSMLSC
jgi:hypothetical protein